MTINFKDLEKITFDGTVYNEVTKSSDNTSAITQENSNVTYDNFLLHSSKEWLSTLENLAPELIKDVKKTSDKTKADNKVLEAAKKAAPDSQAFKDIEKKISEGIKDLAESTSAMIDVTKYGGAINFISSTAVNTVTGAINTTADMGYSLSSPSITNNSNVVVNNSSTSINYSDTVFKKTDRDITVANQQLKSLSDKHSVITNTTSTTSTSNKTTAVSDHQVVSNEQKQYNTSLTSVSAESIVFGSNGTANLLAKTNLTIGAGSTKKTAPSQASITDDISNPISDLNTGGTGSITIQSTGDIKNEAAGTIVSAANTVGMRGDKIGLISIDLSSNSTTTTLASTAQSSLVSDGITYTGNKNIGILVNPAGILAGTGIAPIIPLLGEILPPIVIDIPELPEFPFGNLADFLSKCLPFTSPTTISNSSTVEDEPPDISLEDTVVIQDKGSLEDEPPLISLEDTVVEVDNKDEPVDISLEDPLVVQDKSTKEPAAEKDTKSEPNKREISATPTIKTDAKSKPSTTYTSTQAVKISSQLGILCKTYESTPEEANNPKTTTTQSTATTVQISPKLTYTESLKSITNLQQAEVVNSFNKDVRTDITNNYSDFIKSVAIVDTFGPQTTPLPDYSKTVNDFLLNKSISSQILTFLNTKRPIGVGGDQPPNIQFDISNSYYSGFAETLRTPPTPGQGILDVLALLNNSNLEAGQYPPATTDNWYDAESIDDLDISDIALGDDLLDNANLASFSELLNNKYVDLAKSFIPDSKIQSALSLTQEIANGNIKTPEEYARALSNLIGGEVGGYISYAEQAINIYKSVEQGNYSSLLNIPGVSNVLGSQGTAIASKVLNLISKKNITDKDIYELAGNIFTSLTGIGIPLLDELAKLLGCIDSLKQDNPFLQDISNPDLQDIIDYLPRIIQTTKDNNINRKLLNITPSNCNQISELSAEEATINVTEIGVSYIKFKLSNKDLIKFNNSPLPDNGTYVNLYTEFYTDRITNNVLLPYKESSQFTSNIIEYIITDRLNDEYFAKIINPNIVLTLEDNISGSLYEYTTKDIGNRLIPYILDSYILL